MFDSIRQANREDFYYRAFFISFSSNDYSGFRKVNPTSISSFHFYGNRGRIYNKFRFPGNRRRNIPGCWIKWFRRYCEELQP